MIKLKKFSCFILLSLFLNSSINSADVDTRSESPKKSSFLGGNIAKVAGLGALIAAGTAAAYSKGTPLYPNSYAGDGTALPWNAGLENAGPEYGPYAGLENGPYAGLENGPDNAPPYPLQQATNFAGQSWTEDTSLNNPWGGYVYNNNLEPINEGSAGTPEMRQAGPAITTDSANAGKENNGLEPENGPYAGLENGPYAGLENGPENAPPSLLQQAAQQAANFAGQQWNNLTGLFLQ